jgi:CDP-glycerol glycerophosphotransferase (TagB/SpsB family)
MEIEALDNHTNFKEFTELVKKLQPDAFFSITPYFLDEEFILRAVSTTNARLSTAILSFDNITTRPRIPVIFDQYLLWNDYNKSELMRIYPETKNKQIVIVGSPQFDFYYDKKYLWDEKIWRKRLGIPENRKVILYAAGPYQIAPLEPHWVSQVDSAIQKDELPGKPVILLRRHPVDSQERWNSLIDHSNNIVLDNPWTNGDITPSQTNVTQYDIEKLVSTLAFSDIHINASSTMTIDGAIFDKPQIGPAYDDNERKFHKEMQQLYLREHYLPITNSGGLEIAKNKKELIYLIRQAMEDPDRLSMNRKRMVQEICTFNDGKSTDRVFNALKSFLIE